MKQKRPIKCTISRKEAKEGCIKYIFIPECRKERVLVIPPRTKEGDIFTVTVVNDDIRVDGLLVSYRVRIHVSDMTIRSVVSAFAAIFLMSFVVLKMIGQMPDINQNDVVSYNSIVNKDRYIKKQATAYTDIKDSSEKSKALVKTEETEPPDFIQHYQQRYFLNNLPYTTLENFKVLYKAVKNFERSCVMTFVMDEDEIEILCYMLYYECPELFQLKRGGMKWTNYYSNYGMMQKVKLEYVMDVEDYAGYMLQCRSVADTIAMDVEDCSDYEKELYVYDYITENVTYDKDTDNCGTIVGGIVEGRAKCDGISLTMKWLLEEIGMSSFVLAGSEEGDVYGHAWNVVCIDGVYCDVDVTLDVNADDTRKIKLYGAFNVNRYLVRNLYPIRDVYKNNFELPGTISMEYSYNVIHGDYIESDEDYERIYYSKLTDAYNNDRRIIRLQFENSEDLWDFKKRISEISRNWMIDNGILLYLKMQGSEDYRVVVIEIEY